LNAGATLEYIYFRTPLEFIDLVIVANVERRKVVIKNVGSIA
jgi:hypothetical protein